MKLIATDLDRTLLPNGKQEYNGSMPIFKKILDDKNIKLVFVTGRDIGLVKKAIKEFDTPIPNFIIGDVGTSIYKNIKGEFIEDSGWIEQVSSLTKNWNIKKFKAELSKFSSLRIQENSKQNRFKLSYYVDNPKLDKTLEDEIKIVIDGLCDCAEIIYSVDETNNLGLIDILPKAATKLTGVEYIRKKLGIHKGEVIYCGDSGNDILPLTFGYNSIIVRNAIESVIEEVENNLELNGFLKKLYVAKGKYGLNGYYVSGIIEGLVNFGVISSDFIKRNKKT